MGYALFLGLVSFPVLLGLTFVFGAGVGGGR